MFGKRITLFKLFGFEVRIDFSWFILGLLITWSLADGGGGEETGRRDRPQEYDQAPFS